MNVSFELNGKKVSVEAPPRMTLADALRHKAGATGTHVACEHGVCGSCTIILDGEAVRSCLMLAAQAQGAKITTIEGLLDNGDYTPLHVAFKKHHGLQCGFCTPGVLTTLHALFTQEPDADEERVRDVLSGNLCRCTGYIPIIEAAMEARAHYQAKSRGEA